MQAQVKEWGNSQGIRLSKEVLKSAGIKLNEFLDVEVSDGVITLARQFRHKTLEDRAAEYDGKLSLTANMIGANRLEERCGNGVFTPRRYS